LTDSWNSYTSLEIYQELVMEKTKLKQTVRLSQSPKALDELKTQLQQSIDRLDRGERVDGEEVFRRLRCRIKASLRSKLVPVRGHP
jgi:hypothetical protein